MENVTKALQLKSELDQLRPIPAELEARIMQKFRLDWNYHSNHLEGNSLTFGETRALILHGITAQGKPLKDHIEITGHDEVIKLIEEVVKAQRPLTQSFIRELHALLLKEPYWVDALTPEGNSAKKLITIGAYKTTPNHVITTAGEIFHFAEPYEVQAKMDDLMSRYEKQILRSDVDPIILASEFHYEFVRIHPFDDGNGRMARILMNFILMRFGFPPAIIKTEDKGNYLFALRQADSGFSEFFVEYIAKNLVRSLEIMFAGVRGESIEEPDDLDKKIALLEQKLKAQKIDPTKKTKEKILEICDNSFLKFYEKFVTSCKKFDKFHDLNRVSIEVDKGSNFGTSDPFLVREGVREQTSEIEICYLFSRDATFVSSFRFYFEPQSYTIFSKYDSSQRIVKHYGEQLSESEIESLIKSEMERHYKFLEEKIAKKS